MSWYSKIWQPKSLIVIFLSKDGDAESFSALHVSQSDKSMGKATSFDSLKAIVDEFGKSVPYHFHVEGTGVLSRKINSSPNYTSELILNGDPSEFIFTVFDDGQTIAASFFRKNMVEKSIRFLQENQLHLLGMSSGLVPVFSVLRNDMIEFDFLLQMKNGLISEFTRSENVKDTAYWEEQDQSKESLISTSIFRNLNSPNSSLVYLNDLNSENSIHNYKQYSQFKLFGISILTTIFLSLFINYFYQNSLNNDVAQLEMDLSISNTNISLLDQLEQEKVRKEQLILNAGINSSKFVTYYLDEIGSTVPNGIVLQNLEVFPVIGKLKNKQKINVDKEHIQLSGVTQGNELLDDWIERMERFEWTNRIELLNYLITDNKAEFSLLISLEN